jgi:RNA polymerase sigma-70 factor (ECF subfamily)
MQESELIPHLFRTEYRKIVAVLSRYFGLDHLGAAEDIASDTFLLAAETWGMKGLPGNPTAWLYTVSKNKAVDFLRRNALFNRKISKEIKSTTESADPEIDLSETNILDSQLRMMFAVCHPAISAEAQIGLSLRILCGFGIEEIADAFLSNKETINKRLSRAKEKLRTENIKLELPGREELNQRLESILRTLYLLFNEGYCSQSQNMPLRKDFCLEAMRLVLFLTENETTNQPAAHALLALMCFHASRFEARSNQQGEVILYEDQDESLWNRELIDRGEQYLNQSAKGTRLSRYHLEAAIAYWHTMKGDTPEKWENILQLYNQLLQLEYSPIAALNRTFALSKANGKWSAIREAEKLNLESHHLYHTLLGELYSDIDPGKALQHFEKALLLAKSPADKTVILNKKRICGQAK